MVIYVSVAARGFMGTKIGNVLGIGCSVQAVAFMKY